jgi:peptide/nickel transport system substrate-binding protein
MALSAPRPVRGSYSWLHAEAGTGNEGDPRRVAISFGPQHAPVTPRQVLEAIQGYLRQVGVTMRVVDLEWGTLSQLAAQPVDKSQIQAAFFGWRSVNGDIDSAIQDFGSQFWRPAGNNISFYKSDEFDRLLALEQSTLDPKKRLEALHRMQEILMDDAPAIFLYGEPQIWASRKSLKGIDWNPLESLHPLHRAYFEE